MRIAINAWFLEQFVAGSGQYLAGLVAWLPRVSAGHEFWLVAPRHRPSPAPPGWQVARVSTPFDGLEGNLAKLWFEQVAFPRACRRLRADVALVPYWGSPWWRPCPTVVTVHDLIPLLLPLYRGGPLQRSYTWLVGRTARRADAAITDSEASQRDLLDHLGLRPERVHTVHLAADARFGPVSDPAELARVRDKYALPDGPFFLYIGGFDARKNVVRMIEGYARAIERLRRAGEETSGRRAGIALVIAGALPLHDSAFAPDPRPVVERLGLGDLVRFIGWVDEADKAALYSLALAALYLSEYEGFGLPVLEAMSCGCAVVCGGPRGNQPVSLPPVTGRNGGGALTSDLNRGIRR